MIVNTVKFFDIPKATSILSFFNALNREFKIKIYEYKGVGFVKREELNDDHYSLIVEFKKEYLLKKIIPMRLMARDGYKLVIDSHTVTYRVVGVKYTINTINEQSLMKNKILKFKTLEDQNVLDVIAKVIGRSRFDINYVISNKITSYVALEKSVDAAQLLILLNNQEYEAGFSDVYFDFVYQHEEDRNPTPSAQFLDTHEAAIQPSTSRGNVNRNARNSFRPYNRNRDTPQVNNLNLIKELEKSIKATNKKLDNIVKRIEDQANGPGRRFKLDDEVITVNYPAARPVQQQMQPPIPMNWVRNNQPNPVYPAFGPQLNRFYSYPPFAAQPYVDANNFTPINPNFFNFPPYPNYPNY